jgi:hypothetical protein
MEIALRKAMDKDNQEEKVAGGEKDKAKKSSGDMEAILARTLENRVKSK